MGESSSSMASLGGPMAALMASTYLFTSLRFAPASATRADWKSLERTHSGSTQANKKGDDAAAGK
ncbi:hypothetical protein THAOC_23103, partial [Thalassiosira oceanica]